jgi:hypothetical protein
MVSTTLAKGHHIDLVHCYKFTTVSHDSSTPNILICYYFWTGEDDYSHDQFPVIRIWAAALAPGQSQNISNAVV